MGKFTGEIEIGMGFEQFDEVHDGENIWLQPYTEFYHEGFYRTIDEAIEALLYIKEHADEYQE